MMKKYAYVYKYDGRNRCIQKRIPGCDWTYYVYDKADRLALTQDGIQRPDFKWTVYKYDKLGRMLYSSEVTDIRHMTSFEEWLESFKGWLVTEDFGVPAPCYPMDSTGYTRGFFRQPEYYPTRLLSVNYYDDYRFLELLPATVRDSLQYTHEAGFDTRYENAKGLVTGGRQYQLDDSTKYTVTATYYDYRGCIVQTKSTNHLGGIEAEYIAYDFTGHPTQKKHVHTSPQAGTVTELYTYVYDHAGRPTETRHSLNGGAEQLLAKLSYDELGRVQNHKAGNASVVNTTYGYNVRSWTTGITGSKFKEELVYNYDGNIKQQKTENNGKTITSDFAYDDLSRLTDATTSGTFGTDYTTRYAYDKQGNILHYVKGEGSPRENDLTMEYNGNQIKKAHNSTMNGEIPVYSGGLNDYAYNANGAMTKDLNKGISSISYNLLNLPQQVDVKSPIAEARNTYSYSAGGAKLRVVQQYNSNYNTSPVIGSTVNLSLMDVTKTTDYAGNKVFENNALKRILVDGGYIENSTYYFYETDHLGDNRVVVNQSGSSIQNTDYYPFGKPMAHSTSAGVQPYKFGGKEYDTMHGLDWYDFEARMLGTDIPVLPTPDPMAEKYYSWSPYVYCGDNPIKYVDKNGKEKLIYYYAPTIDAYNASTYPDDNAIHVFSHGSPKLLMLNEFAGHTNARASSGEELSFVLDHDSQTWQNRNAGDQLVVVLHGCNAGEVDANGQSLAGSISASGEFKDVVIIAPDKKFIIEASEEGMLYSGVSGVKYVIIDGQLVRVANKEDMGQWVVYKNGKVIDTIPGDQIPKYRDTSENSKREYSPEEINFWKKISDEFEEMYYKRFKSE